MYRIAFSYAAAANALPPKGAGLVGGHSSHCLVSLVFCLVSAIDQCINPASQCVNPIKNLALLLECQAGNRKLLFETGDVDQERVNFLGGGGHGLVSLVFRLASLSVYLIYGR
jgi:hypothetical protein